MKIITCPSPTVLKCTGLYVSLEAVSHVRQDDMMERREWGPDVRLYIGPDKGTGHDTGWRRCMSHAHYHVHHIL